MKSLLKKSIYVFLPLLVSVFSGCEKEIEFDGDITRPGLTLASQASVGSPLTVYVSSSIFFLENEETGNIFFENLDTARGKVRCFVNGSNSGEELVLMRQFSVNSLCYMADYVPAPGDHIRLEAEFPGYDMLWAETDVPLMPDFELLSVTWKKSETDNVSWLFEDEEQEYYEAELTLAVTDNASYEKYYFLQPLITQTDPWTQTEWTTSLTFTSNDVIFQQMDGSQLQVSTLDGGFFTGGYFSDALIKGQRYVFKIQVSYVPDREKLISFDLLAAAVNENLYWYDNSYLQVAEGMNGLFGEGVTLYSNVHGGYGVFCAAAPVFLKVEW